LHPPFLALPAKEEKKQVRAQEKQQQIQGVQEQALDFQQIKEWYKVMQPAQNRLSSMGNVMGLAYTSNAGLTGSVSYNAGSIG